MSADFSFYHTAPFIPLNQGPPPGPDFLTQAELIDGVKAVFQGKGKQARLVSCGAALTDLYRQALYNPYFTLNVLVKQQTVATRCLPGHLWTQAPYQACGPVPSSVMVIGKCPGEKELQHGRNFYGESSVLFSDILYSLGCSVEVMQQWYVTNVIKHPPVDPSSSRIPAAHLANWLPVLYRELAIVRPRFILCLGKEAAAAVLDRNLSMYETAGRVFEIELPPFETKPAQKAQVVVAMHPAAILHNPDVQPQVVSGLNHFWRVVTGRHVSQPRNRDWRLVKTIDQLQAIVDEVKKLEAPIIFLDAEWQGDRHTSLGSYLRSIQFSHRPGFACYIPVRQAGGSPDPDLPDAEVQRLLRELFRPGEGYRPRAAGHNFRADLPRLIHYDPELGDLVLHAFLAAPSPQQMRTHGGLDTMLLAHAYRETGFSFKFSLDSVCMELLASPNWAADLEQWKQRWCEQNQCKEEDLGGYGLIPDEILFPYGCADVDYPRELIERAVEPGGLLDGDRYGQSSWTPFWRSMRSSPAFFEMEQTGIHVDMATAERLIEIFQSRAAELLTEIREAVHWPDFNPGSIPQCKELLYGETYNGTKDKRVLRPEGALSLYLQPIRTSSKPAKDWNRLSEFEKGIYAPSTDKEVLGILKDQHAVVDQLRKYRFLSQVLKTTLRPASAGRDGFVEIDEETGQKIYNEGLLGFVQPDGRVYTSLFPTQETGRCSSVRPPLTTLGKKREADYQIILGSRYDTPIRSILTATPPCSPEEEDDPWILVDFDLKGAELYMTGIQAQDAVMIEHCRRNNLEEDDPDYYDIHSAMAVAAFHLNCPPTKHGLKSIQRSALRVAAKTLIFGSLYGRGDEAILRAILEETKGVTLQDVRRLRETLFSRYSRLRDFFSACAERVINPGYIRNCFGRLRRFTPTSDREALAKLQREAGNFPIQSGIADIVHNWMYLIQSRSDRYDAFGRPRYRLLLQIHDALLAECRVSALNWFVDEVIKPTLASIAVYACDLDGRRLPGIAPYHLHTDISLHFRWGVDLTEEERRRYGISL